MGWGCSANLLQPLLLPHPTLDGPLDFACIIPSARLALLSPKRECPSEKGKGPWGEQRTSPAFCGATQRFWHPPLPPRPVKREVEGQLGTMKKRSRGYQCEPGSRSNCVSQWPGLQMALAAFFTEEIKGQHHCHRPPADFMRTDILLH